MAVDLTQIQKDLRAWAAELGFDRLGVARLETREALRFLDAWLARGRHGEMAYMARHRDLRADPSQWIPGALSVISVRMDYLPMTPEDAMARLADREQAAISVYALGRDYHKLMRQRLQKLATRMEAAIGPFGYRVFSDSAPLFEKSFAQDAGLGWIGKHTNLIDRKAGSFFFLGEIVTDLALPEDVPVSAHCGSCTACITACPTAAIVAPYQLDARRCISYLTIELKGTIPMAFRKSIGNRVYGCDDCQLVCPWNRYAQITREEDFLPRQGLDRASMVELFAWSEDEFNRKLEGSAIRRIGYESWLRNLAIGLGNAPYSPKIVSVLRSRSDDASAVVREVVAWALGEQAIR
jgi:epoxyqueuosine reductase